MIRNGNHAAFFIIIVSANEIHIGLTFGNHKRRRNFYLTRHVNIRSFTVIVRASGMINAFRNRPFENGATVVIVYVFHVGREHNPVIVVYLHGEISPPHKRVSNRGLIIYGYFRTTLLFSSMEIATFPFI